jgi:hypothetical protein
MAIFMASMVAVGGCSMEMTRASASLAITIPGMVDAKAEAEWERTKEEKGGGLSPFGASTLASVTKWKMSAENATIPDQDLVATVSMKDEAGRLVGAKQFLVNVRSGVVDFEDSNAPAAWLTEFDDLERGKLGIEVESVDVRLPAAGVYTVRNELVVGGAVVASASASGVVSRGGIRPPVRPR